MTDYLVISIELSENGFSEKEFESILQAIEKIRGIGKIKIEYMTYEMRDHFQLHERLSKCNPPNLDPVTEKI